MRARHAGSWIIAAVPPGSGASGGSIRAHAIFAALARRTGAAITASGDGRGLLRELLRRPVPGTRLASAQFISPRALRVLSPVVRPAVVDMHDAPVLHAEALGVPFDEASRRRVDALVAENVRRFDCVVVTSEAFADLCRIPNAKALVIGNGTDTAAIRPAPPPSDRQVVAFASGAAPARGIEALIEAMRRIRAAGQSAELAMALSATGERSAAYLRELRQAIANDKWIAISNPPYASITTFLAEASVVAIPHPPSTYYDVIQPVKLFDAMAAGRPVVVTPRMETARIVEQADAGIVAGDAIDDLAGALVEMLDAPERAQRLGRNGREAAVREYDWRSLSERLADSVLAG
jgi:glycosyltransferase involved in cell wall biosynthesis